MDFGIGRDLSPPANDRIVPDVYNVLDAHLVKKTTTINNMLKYRLNSQEKVLSKHRRDAVRYIVNEKARTVDTLNRIQNKLNAVSRIKDFDLKFSNQRTIDTDFNPKKKQRGYERDRNEDAICQRCYIHHLPLKKKFYRADDDSPHKHERHNFLDSKHKFSEENRPNYENGTADEDNDSPENDIKEVPNIRTRRLSSPMLSRRGSIGLGGKTAGAFGWWMPTPKNQQFLWKDKSGREVDVNQGATPRLAPNEEWKKVVENVCTFYPNRRRRKNVDLNQTL